MANYILVPLNPSDQVEEIIPRIDQVAQAGMTVIFLIPYQANGFFKNRQMRAEFSAKGLLTDRKALTKYLYEKQTQAADERASVAREAVYGGMPADDKRNDSQACQCNVAGFHYCVKQGRFADSNNANQYSQEGR